MTIFISLTTDLRAVRRGPSRGLASIRRLLLILIRQRHRRHTMEVTMGVTRAVFLGQGVGDLLTGRFSRSPNVPLPGLQNAPRLVDVKLPRCETSLKNSSLSIVWLPPRRGFIRESGWSLSVRCVLLGVRVAGSWGGLVIVF